MGRVQGLSLYSLTRRANTRLCDSVRLEGQAAHGLQKAANGSAVWPAPVVDQNIAEIGFHIWVEADRSALWRVLHQRRVGRAPTHSPDSSLIWLQCMRFAKSQQLRTVVPFQYTVP